MMIYTRSTSLLGELDRSVGLFADVLLDEMLVIPGGGPFAPGFKAMEARTRGVRSWGRETLAPHPPTSPRPQPLLLWRKKIGCVNLERVSGRGVVIRHKKWKLFKAAFKSLLQTVAFRFR